MAEYRCRDCRSTEFMVYTDLPSGTAQRSVGVTCRKCETTMFAPTVAEAFRAISQGEKKEEGK
jgi:hypothetical protein